MTARTIWDLLLAVLATTFFAFALIADDAVAREVGTTHRDPALTADHPERRTAIAALIIAALDLSPPLARLEAGLRLVPEGPEGSVLTSASELRLAADLGSWARSRGYVRVSQELGDAIAEGSAPDATTREWTRCYQRGNGAAVICPDGYVEVN